MNLSLVCPDCGTADAYRMNVFSGTVSDKPRTILYSSGFTGEPKCACRLTSRRLNRLHKLAVAAARKREAVPA